MIRPEAAAALHRWREAGIGGAALALGLWLLATSAGLPWLLGLAATLVGAVLLPSGLRRGRLRGAQGGAGVVAVVEGEIAYLGPADGGRVAVEDLREVSFVRDARGARWRLAPADGPTVEVPDGAVGAERLLDALSPLPGFDGGAMVRARATPGTTIVWRRDPLPALPRLRRS